MANYPPLWFSLIFKIVGYRTGSRQLPSKSDCTIEVMFLFSWCHSLPFPVFTDARQISILNIFKTEQKQCTRFQKKKYKAQLRLHIWFVRNTNVRKHKGAVKICMTVLKMRITCKCDRNVCELLFAGCVLFCLHRTLIGYKNARSNAPSP